MRCTYPSIFFFLLACLCSFYQSSAQPITTVGGSLENKELIFIAETHSIEEKDNFYNALIPYLVREHDVRNIVLEAGHSHMYLLNKFMTNDDSTLFRHAKTKKEKEFLRYTKAMYEALPANKKITFYGMDFERVGFIESSIMILSDNNVPKSNELYKYLNSLPDSATSLVYMTVEQSRDRLQIYRHACKLFSKEKKYLQKIVNKDYDVLRRIFENPAREDKFSRRDRGMYRNIKKQLKDKPFLCIAGGYHITYRRHQVYPSLIKLMTRRKPKNERRLAIIEEVSNRKYLSHKLMEHNGDAPTYTSGKEGPDYITKNDNAMNRAYANYCSTPGNYRLIHKSVFSDIIHRDNHGLESYYIFLGDCAKNSER